MALTVRFTNMILQGAMAIVGAQYATDASASS
jgi:hypothetical protein